MRVIGTIDELAADPGFDPDATGLSPFDLKPYGWHVRRAGGEPRRAGVDCEVPGCGVRYAPGGVCGYCRAKVKLIRGDMVPLGPFWGPVA